MSDGFADDSSAAVDVAPDLEVVDEEAWLASQISDVSSGAIPAEDEAEGEEEAAETPQELNQEQARAVFLDIGSSAMVLAGAGTGKTAVLTRRIAHLISQGVSPENILAVTFTNKAAREMKVRLAKLGVRNAPDMGTFHSIGLRILKSCPQAVGVDKGFTILDDDDRNGLWESLFVRGKNHSDDGDDLKFDRKRSSDGEGEDQESWRHARRRMFNLKEMPDKAHDIVDDDHRRLEIYEAKRKQLNLVDFSDLISGSLSAMKDFEDGAKWTSKYTHVLVDEFQDTSAMQFEWLRVIGPRATFFCVGDDCQSIYAFRGAAVDNIRSFVEEHGAEVISLEQNYRSGKWVLLAANNLISFNPGGLDKRLTTPIKEGAMIIKQGFEDEVAECEWVASSIKEAGACDNTAILVRTRAAMLPVAKAFREHGIPYRLVGAKDFFDSKEIRDAMAIIRLAINRRDEISFKRVASLFPGVGDASIEKVLNEFRCHDDWSLIECSACFPKTAQIAIVYDEIDRGSSPGQAVPFLLEKTGLIEYCESEAERMSNLAEFMKIAGESAGGLAEFIEELTLFAEKDDSGKRKGVTVSTIHAAKGLEWESVYLPLLYDGHIPLKKIHGKGKSECDIEEERRLMYVAITRARRNLVMTYPKQVLQHGKTITPGPSQFIFECRAANPRPEPGYLVRAQFPGLTPSP